MDNNAFSIAPTVEANLARTLFKLILVGLLRELGEGEEVSSGVSLEVPIKGLSVEISETARGFVASFRMDIPEREHEKLAKEGLCLGDKYFSHTVGYGAPVEGLLSSWAKNGKSYALKWCRDCGRGEWVDF